MNNLHRFLAILCMIILLPMATWAQGHDYSQDYLTFNVITGGTISWKSVGSGMAKTISYSINNGAWTSITASGSASISVDANDVVRFKGSNSAYGKSRSDYSGFEGGTATYNISGNIMSLVYGDEFIGQTTFTLTGEYNFCSIFKLSKAVSAENLILPATTLTNYCYRAMFSKAPNMAKAPALPATTLAKGCYWYMFEECPITTAPDLDATTLVAECYGHMFCNCSSLNYINCLATTGFNTSRCLENWAEGVAATGTFIKDADATSWSTGISGIPTGWTVKEMPSIPTISCDGREIELTCGTQGADIYYQLNHSGGYTQYTTAIQMTDDTFIECYSEKVEIRSETVSQACEYDDRTIYEYSNQSLDTWTYKGNTITTPYSVNAIDGHSSSYAKGTFNFETDVNLRDPQTDQLTYLWFQHADQSAVISVDGTEVTKHWGGYNAFFVDITDHVHKGTNHIKVALKNNEGNVLAPYTGDFNFNATLGNVKLFTSPYLPSMSYGYDGFHITSTVSSAEATINVKTTIPDGASVKCTISGTNCTYTETKSSTGNELVFTTTITNPHLWNGTIDPYLYNVKLEIYHDNELYHSYDRPYGLRFYEYVFNQTVNGNSYTGFLLNGQPYLLRGCCMHDDIAGKANALNDDDYTQTFNIIQELGLNFLRLAHYPHPKEVYDWCDRLGIVVQTEVPCVNHLQTTMPEAYWTHLTGQYNDMVNQHYNHPCIMFWGLSNEAKVTDSNEGREFAKDKIEGYVSQIKALDSERMVGLVGHALNNPIAYFGSPTNIDWIGSNLYEGWYQNKTSNNPTTRLNTCITNTVTNAGKAFAFSEYGCGGTQACHSDEFKSTTTTGNNPRHDIEYQMWLHEGHIAAIKNKPELLFTSQWQLFDIAVSNRQEGYKVSLDGETVFDDNELKRLNNKGLVERDHVTKKDTYYLYKAWWNQTDKFVHICGKDYEKSTNRVIKCYTNDGNSLSLYVNNSFIESVSVANNIATFTARAFDSGDVIKVKGATTNDTFTFINNRTAVLTTSGNWNIVSNWSDNIVPTVGSDVVIAANATIPADYVAHVDEISINEGTTLTIADGGQLYHTNEGVTATVQKNIQAWTITQNNGEDLTNGWYLIGYSFADDGAIADMDNLLENEYDLFYYDEPTHHWRNNLNPVNNFTKLEAARGYLYANSKNVTIGLTGTMNASDAEVTKTLSYTTTAGSLAGFNLVGNPFVHNVTTYTGTHIADECYRMNDARTDIVVDNINNDNPLKTGEGFFVKATDGGASIAFNSASKDDMTKTERIKLEIREHDQLIDRLIVKREGEPLEKITLNDNGTNIFALHNNQKVAVIPIEGDELPVYFKTDKNGIYTISLSTENTTLHYLHLIDNITGDEVDLLQNPSYSFNAFTMDHADRFKLVFIGGNANADNKNFAFISDGDIIITADVENATLQVIDVMGRVIVSRNVDVLEQVPTSGMTYGTYILRLIDGNNVMTQKIVIR